MKSLGKDLRRLIPSDRVLTDPEDLVAYANDATYHVCPIGNPEAIVLPETTKEVSRVVRYAAESIIPVVPRGGGTGLSGGCTPTHGGIVLDLKRMRRIVEINQGNMTARVEAGMVTATFQEVVEKQGLFYPPDPQSMKVSTLGGNISTRAGGPRAVKYGTTGQYVLGLEVVLPDGEVIRTGSSCSKSSVGYDVTHLYAGAEGTLGVITEAILRLVPLPPARKTVVVTSAAVEDSARIVSAVIASGIVPAMIELISRGAAAIMSGSLPEPYPGGESHLLVELDGSEWEVDENSREIRGLCEGMGAVVRVIEDRRKAEAYWEAREKFYGMLLKMAKKGIVEDVTVPRDRIPEFVRAVSEVADRLEMNFDRGMMIGLSGHAGDGNMHPTIFFLRDVTEKEEEKARRAIEELVKTGLSIGGTISGEYGIGIHKAEFIELELGKRQVDLMRCIKAAVDPKNIMNPGKIWIDGEAPGTCRTIAIQ